MLNMANNSENRTEMKNKWNNIWHYLLATNVKNFPGGALEQNAYTASCITHTNGTAQYAHYWLSMLSRLRTYRAGNVLFWESKPHKLHENHRELLDFGVSSANTTARI